MFRRLTAALIVWMGLAGVLPAVCAAAAMTANCCGAGTPCSPDSSSLSLQAAQAECCVASPASAQTVSATYGKRAHERDDKSGSPDFVASIGSTVAWGVPAAPRLSIVPSPQSPRSDASLTYLHTARLRL